MKKTVIIILFLCFSLIGAKTYGAHRFVGHVYDLLSWQDPVEDLNQTRKILLSLKNNKIKDLPENIYQRDGYKKKFNNLIKIKVSVFDRYRFLVGKHRINDFLCRDHNIKHTPFETYAVINPLILKKIFLIEKKIKKGGIVITSGHRTPHYNNSLDGSAKNSRHLYGTAVDIIPVDGLTKKELRKIIRTVEKENPSLKGYNKTYAAHVHTDVR